MQVGTCPTRNFATLGLSRLEPPFTGASVGSFSCDNLLPSLTGTGQASDRILPLACSHGPVFLINSCCCRFTVAPNSYSKSRAPLIANLRGHFAEFLNQRSPERLSILYSPTCVSFSTVSLNVTLRSFSWTFGGQLPNQVVESPFSIRSRAFDYAKGY